MFQYATARAVAIRNGVPLRLDISWFASVCDRNYALAPFRIEATLLPKQPARRSTYWVRLSDYVSARLGLGKRGSPCYVEKSFGFDPAVVALRPPVYLDGYFQSAKYFEAMRQQISSEFTLREEPRQQTREMLQQIRETDSICLHVRRGDYVSNSATNAYHGTCSLDYYWAGLDVASQGLAHPHCFVFSDDTKWVRENVRVDLPVTWVDIHSTQEAHEDLRLMVACRRFVIANSSLSWWGAWLGSQDGKVVVAPQRWFQSSDNDTRDLIPAAWLRVSA